MNTNSVIVYFSQEIEPTVGEALTKLWDRKEPLSWNTSYNQSSYSETPHSSSEGREYRSGHHEHSSYHHQPYNQFQGGYYSPEGNPEMMNPARLYGSMNSHPSLYQGYMMSPPRQNPVTILQRNQNHRYNQGYSRQHGPGGDH